MADVETLPASTTPAHAARRARWRGAGSAFLLVLGCGLAALSVVAIWLRVTLLDTDHYVKTVAPIAAQPAVQNAVASKINAAIDEKLDVHGLLRQALPDRADVLAPAIAAGFESVVRSRVDDFTHSPKFQEIWTEANRRAHARVVALLEGGQSKNLLLKDDTVYLDLSGVVNQVRDGLRRRGYERLAGAIPASVDGQIPLVQSDALPKAQGAVRLLKAIAILLPVLALLCLAGSTLLARRRLRGLFRAGLGVVAAMLLLIAAVGVARSAYLSAIPADVLPRNASSEIYDATVAFLRHGVRIVAAFAIVIALLAFLLGQPLRRMSAAVLARVGHGPWVAWMARYERPLMLGVAAVGGLWLLLSDPLTASAVLWALLVVGLTCGVIAAISSQAGEGERYPHRTDHRVAGG